MTDEILKLETQGAEVELPSETEFIEEADIPEDLPVAEESASDTSDTRSEIDEVQTLKNEINELRRQLDERQGYFDRMSREIGEFSSLFPEKALSEIPDSVWNEVRSGIPLAASYALYEKKLDASRERAEKVNQKNKESSTGAIGRTAVEGFFTPDEVRAMSREEIKKHYPKIIESMKKWN